jgi:hypothetical protein
MEAYLNKIYMVIGCPGTGKTWVCNQLREHFHCVPQGNMSSGVYVDEVLTHAKVAHKPILIEAPFGVTEIKTALETCFKVIPIFIQEDLNVIRDRYFKREGKQIPPGNLTRQNTYKERAEAWGAYQGTSSECLAHLVSLASMKGKL